MAFPLAIPAVVAEGLVFIRKAIVTYRLTKQAIDPDDKIHLFVNKGLKNHFSVKGEEFYLYLVGEKMIESLYNNHSLKLGDPLPEGQIEQVIYRALADPQFLTASLDASSIVSSFAYSLGAQWQIYDANADDILKSTLSSTDDDVDISDVVRKYLVSTDSIPERLQRIAHRLGLLNEELDYVLTLLRGDDTHKAILSSWEQSEQDFIDSGLSVYRAHTFQSFMLVGAMSMFSVQRSDIALANGDDAPSLTLGYLFAGKASEFKPDRYAEFSSITLSQIQTAGELVMRLQGLVYSTSERKYVPLNQVEICKDDDTNSLSFISKTSDSQLLVGRGISSNRSDSKMILSLIDKYIKEQPMMDDIEEWRRLYDDGSSALKLISEL